MPPRASPSTLIIRHIPGSHPAAFQVTRLSHGKTAEPASPPSLVGFPVEGRPSSDLMHELQWYLETFLEYPFPPETDHAERVLESLKHWGEQTSEAPFGSGARLGLSLPRSGGLTAHQVSGCSPLRVSGSAALDEIYARAEKHSIEYLKKPRRRVVKARSDLASSRTEPEVRKSGTRR
jgi:hypothetical protein